MRIKPTEVTGTEVIVKVILPLTFKTRFGTTDAICDVYNSSGEYVNVTAGNDLGHEEIRYGVMNPINNYKTDLSLTSVFIMTIGI